MRISNIDFPEPLLHALLQDDLVVFAGAGVSMGKPACLPSFHGLAMGIAHGTGITMEPNEPEDRFLGRLHRRGVKVHQKAIEILEAAKPAPTEIHLDILRLFPSAQQARIVSTNFDLLFQEGLATVFGQPIETYIAPALPLGHNFKGIVQVHGSQTKPAEIVLTDSDFGKAYLTEGWAARFLAALFQRFTVLIIGYSHRDPIVNYLARALPESQNGKRFALVPADEDAKHWDFLGIEPVQFPRPIKADYSGLNNGIRGLARFAKLSLLDWQGEIEAITSNAPPIDPEIGEKILWALKEVPTTRFFVRSCLDPVWVPWLNERQAFDSLFKPGDLSEAEAMLGNWLAFQFSRQHPEMLFWLIAKKGMQVNPRFWRLLVGEVAAKRANPSDPKLLLKWISLLVAMAPNSDALDALWALAERCREIRLIPGALRIMEALLEGWIALEVSSRVGSDLNTPRPRLAAGIAGGHHQLEELWNTCLKPNLKEVCGPILETTTRRFQDFYSALEIWEEVSRDWDAASYRRHAIEPHDQDMYHNSPLDALIDITRDCLEWMADHAPAGVAEWSNRHIQSDASLLRRLSIHALSCRQDLDGDGKISWLLSNLDLFDNSLHHETYRAMAGAYTSASDPARKRVLEAIQRFRWSENETEEGSRKSAWLRFSWLHWLSQANPACPMVGPEMEMIRVKYPEVVPGRFPDFSHWVASSDYHTATSPWTSEELVAKPAKEWVADFLSYSDKRSYPDSGRELLLQTISAAAKKSSTWGLDLAAELGDQGQWSSDLWPPIIGSWDGYDLEHRAIALQWLGRMELHKEFPREIAQILLGWSKSTSSPLSMPEIPPMHTVASNLLASLDRSTPTSDGQDWARKAHSHPAGLLTEFYLHTLDAWRRAQIPVPVTMSAEFSAIFGTLLGDLSIVGKMGCAILAGNLHFLLGVDELWTKQNVMSRFARDTMNSDFQVMWNGFLWSPNLTPRTIEELEPLVLSAVSGIIDELAPMRDRFIELFTVFVTFYAQDPIGVWIPALYKAGGTKALDSFNRHVELHLRTKSKSGLGAPWTRWLRDYWKNRIEGVPERLVGKESESVLDWLPHLDGHFPEGVELALRMPPRISNYTLLMHELKDCHLINRYPSEAAALMIHFGKGQDGAFGWYGAKEVFGILLAASIGDDLKKGIRELAAKLGEHP